MTRAGMLRAASAMLLPLRLAATAADPAAPMPSEHRLSPEEVEKVLEQAARKNAGPAPAEIPGEPDAQAETPASPVHGEVGFAIGTGGYRSAHGTAYVPLGNGQAIVSFGTDRFRDRDFYQDYGPYVR